MGVCPYSADIETNVFAETLDNISQVQAAEEYQSLAPFIDLSHSPQSFEYQAQVPTMFECPFKPYDMFLVFRVSLL